LYCKTLVVDLIHCRAYTWRSVHDSLGWKVYKARYVPFKCPAHFPSSLQVASVGGMLLRHTSYPCLRVSERGPVELRMKRSSSVAVTMYKNKDMRMPPCPLCL